MKCEQACARHQEYNYQILNKGQVKYPLAVELTRIFKILMPITAAKVKTITVDNYH